MKLAALLIALVFVACGGRVASTPSSEQDPEETNSQATADECKALVAAPRDCSRVCKTCTNAATADSDSKKSQCNACQQCNQMDTCACHYQCDDRTSHCEVCRECASRLADRGCARLNGNPQQVQQ